VVSADTAAPVPAPTVRTRRHRILATAKLDHTNGLDTVELDVAHGLDWIDGLDPTDQFDSADQFDETDDIAPDRLDETDDIAPDRLDQTDDVAPDRLDQTHLNTTYVDDKCSNVDLTPADRDADGWTVVTLSMVDRRAPAPNRGFCLISIPRAPMGSYGVGSRLQ
jgi:hypothetical protein